ncbi:MAG: hypothetical protein Q7T18_07185, partial [Sedimentisphaerales bacterium]|nr:hypothetical protein [Sedimentisphaerales bacterium]
MNSRPQPSQIFVFFAAVIIYAAFAVYLYLPHLNHFSPYRPLLIPAAAAAAAGTYLLSLRWISNPVASFFAGLLYAFGPFTLGFALYHPAASLLVAVLPFTLLPAAGWHGLGGSHHRWMTAWPWWTPLVTAFLTTLPFITIIAFFAVAAHYGFFPIPHNQKLCLAPYAGLLTPLILKPLHFPYPGFYHIAIAPLIFGMFLFFRLHRIGAIAFCIIGIALAYYAAIGETSPIVWALLPTLCFSIVAALGLEGLVIASAADKASLTNCAVCMAAIAAASAVVGFKSSFKTDILFFRAAAWYTAAAFAVYLILLLAT